ncbi:MAG: methylated-DNA--[protein]-cysteine S-methyltransferase [Mucilaginibacter sp.]|nr:methylated-DNA--[protein]-cysteine S-methyltransferase [Mucilaginibacter sp.]
MLIAHYRTPVGIARITEEQGFISSVNVLDDEILLESPETPLLETAIKQLDEYFAGIRQIFDLPIKQHGTSFQQEVWQCLLTIGYGKTISYAQQSKLMKNRLAIRAIASANGKNNLWVVVPCHRVIGSDGGLTGYSSGIWRKRWLLEHEAHTIGAGQIKLF